MPLVLPTGVDDDLAPYVATWPDGDRKEVAEKTNAAIREIMKGAHKTTNLHMLNLVHKPSNNIVIVKQKPDNRLLMSVFEQRKWIAGVAVQEFAQPGEALLSVSGKIAVLPN